MRKMVYQSTMLTLSYMKNIHFGLYAHRNSCNTCTIGTTYLNLNILSDKHVRKQTQV